MTNDNDTRGALTVAIEALKRLAEVPGCGCAFPCRCGGAEWTRAELEGRMDVAAEALREIESSAAQLPAGDGLTVPNGWQLVPMEPTDAMVKIAIGQRDDYPDIRGGRKTYPELETKRAYRAMLNVCPAAPRQPGEVGAGVQQDNTKWNCHCGNANCAGLHPNDASAQQDEREAGDTYLCMAWGETDFPAAAMVTDMGAVRAFLIEQWLGSADETDDEGVNLLDWALRDMHEQWALDGEAWKWEVKFEIGGVSVRKVDDFTPPRFSAAQQVQADAVAVAEGYGATDFGYTFAGIELAEGDKRLMSMLVKAFGTEHPAVDDMAALLFRAHPAPAAESDKRDAERYRWLRGQADGVVTSDQLQDIICGKWADEWDAAIDAAMSREQSGGGE